MSILERVIEFPRSRHADPRGWLVKTLTGSEPYLPEGVGEIYVVMAAPGQVRGNHYHPRTAEWFTVLMGAARLSLLDPVNGERREMRLDGERPTTVYVPPGIAHAFCTPNGSDAPMLLLAYADRPYDPEDVIPVEVL